MNRQARNASELLAHLRSKGVLLHAKGESLSFNAPKGVLTPELQAELQEWKPELLTLLRACDNGSPKGILPINKDSRLSKRDGPIPLSVAQERFYFLHRLDPDSPGYNITAFWRINEDVRPEIVSAGLRVLVQRHEILRTVFTEYAGVPVQKVVELAHLAVDFADLSELSPEEQEAEVQRTVREQAARPFDLATAPLFRVGLCRLSGGRSVLILSIHHIIADATSLGIFYSHLDEIARKIAASREDLLPPAPLQYADYVAWERRLLNENSFQETLDYWRKKLAGFSGPPELPIDRPRPVNPSSEGATYTFSIPPETAKRLKSLAAHEHATLYMVLVTAFKILLYRYSNQPDVVVGTPFDMRNSPELESLIGPFVNTLVLRTEISKDATARATLNSVRETVMEAHTHSAASFERLIELAREHSDVSKGLFRAAFFLQNTFLAAGYESVTTSSKFDLSLFMWERGGALGAAFEYSTELFDETTIARISRHFTQLLDSIAEDPDRRISELALLDERERGQVIEEWNATARDYDRELTLGGWFEQSAARHPERTAVVFEDRRLSYRELDERSNALARRLRECKIGPGELVGVCLERGEQMVVAVLGVLKAGGAYVPLDPQYPRERLEFMLRDSGAKVLLSQQTLRDRVAAERVICVDADRHWIEQAGVAKLEPAAKAEDLAYVIYTSGSTGKPKGVEVMHRSVVNFLASMQRQPGMGASDRLLAVTTLSFDIAGLELYLPLVSGAELVVAPRAALADGAALAKLWEECGATMMQATPVTWRLLLESGWRSRAGIKMLCGGEALPRELAKRLVEGGGELWNLYGPTETTIWSTAERVSEGAEAIGIGRPIDNTQVYVLDEQRRPVPVGVSGELYIGGEGLARGYWRRAELTRERFVENPFRAGERMYRTGDVARWRADGRLQYLGRADHQVKLRGHRIELGEIELCLEQLPQVRQAVVVVREGAGGARLVAYAVPEKGSRIDAKSLRQALQAQLPDYMVPSAFVSLDKFPLTPNNKIDRKALPEPKTASPFPERPRTPLEARILEVWRDVLEVESIGVHDNFFELGGHSLLALRLFAQLEPIFGRLRVSLLFEAPTISELAEKLSVSGVDTRWRSLVAIQSGGSNPPLFVIPGAQGNALHSTQLAWALGPDQPVYAFHSVGLDGDQKPLDNVEEIADYFIKELRTVQPNGPYSLVGICMGGAVAFEMARRLTSEGESVANLVMVETWMPHAIQRGGLREFAFFRQLFFLKRRIGQHIAALKELDKPGRVQYLSRLMKLAGQAMSAKKLHSSFRTEMIQQIVVQTNNVALSRYKPRRFDGSAVLILADGTAMDPNQDPRLGWAALTSGASSVYRLKGANADALMREPVVHQLASRIAEAVRESSPAEAAANR